MTKMRPRSLKSALVLVIAGLVVLLVAAIVYYLDDIFQSLQDPGQPFQTYQKPVAPDYAVADGWIAIPDLNADPFEHPALGDAFVIVPSVYRGGEHWNLPVDDDRRRNKLQRIVRPNYVAPYGSAGRLFAPHYRQASIYTSMTAREDARRAQDFAYQDVRRAFDVFLKHSPPERPIIIAGHGQGASHAQRILADYFQGPLKTRLAAAYIIDHPMPLDQFSGQLSDLVPCEGEIDTGCVVAFGAFMPKDDVTARRFVSRLKVYDGQDYEIVDGRPLLCVNPLLWNRSSDYAPRRLHLGGIAGVGMDPEIIPAPLTRQTGAQCQDNILYVDQPKSRALRRPVKFGGKFRTLPSNLFYEDLRINASKRVKALIENGRLPTRVKKLDDLDVIDIVDSPVTPVDEK